MEPLQERGRLARGARAQHEQRAWLGLGLGLGLGSGSGLGLGLGLRLGLGLGLRLECARLREVGGAEAALLERDLAAGDVGDVRAAQRLAEGAVVADDHHRALVLLERLARLRGGR